MAGRASPLRRRRRGQGLWAVGKLHGTRKRRTSCGQPQATAIFPAQSRASSLSATSTTAKPPMCSLVSVNGPSVNNGVPLDASTLNTGAVSSRPPVKMKTPGGLHLRYQRPDSLGLLAQLLDRVVGMLRRRLLRPCHRRTTGSIRCSTVRVVSLALAALCHSRRQVLTTASCSARARSAASWAGDITTARRRLRRVM